MPNRPARPLTVEEERWILLDHIHNLVDYWSALEAPHSEDTIKARLDGLAFSILSALDGCSVGIPSYDVIPHPHPEDKQYSIENNIDWHSADSNLTDVPLHDQWLNRPFARYQIT